MVDLKKYRLKYVTDRKGKKTDVILKVKDFQELIDDLNDLSIVKERQNEETVSHDELIKDLKQNAML